MFYLAWPFCLAIFTLTWYSNTRVADQKFFLSCWLLNTYWVCTSQLTSVLFIYLKLEVYFFGEEFVTIFIALFFLSKLSRNSFFSRIAESHLRSNLSCQRQWKNCIEMKLVAPVTDQRLFFSLGASRRERSVSIRKKYPLEHRVGTPTVTLSWISTNLVLNSYVIGYVTPIQLCDKQLTLFKSFV